MLRDAAGAIGRPTGAQRRVGPFMLAALAALLVGLWAGLARIGWDLPEAGSDLMLRHGGLMVVGFVATLIAVERAVAVQSVVAFTAPALSAAAGVALIVDAPDQAAPALASASGVAYVLNIAVLLQRFRQPALAVSLAGGVCLLVAGVVWWDGGGLQTVVPWWMAFLVLTIVAERLELIKFQRFTPFALLTGIGLLAAVMVALVLTLFEVDDGVRLMGVAFLLGPFWLVRRDIAHRTIRTEGIARFSAAGVLTAYAWLVVTGAMLLAWGIEPGLRYDAVVHACFIGFVFTAIIAHEPIIVPAVTGLRFTYTPALYLPLLLLNGGLVARVAADLAEDNEVRRWAGMVQAIAILLFLAISAASLFAGSLRRSSLSRPRTGSSAQKLHREGAPR
ncbi:MAG TPA: hypothetical protein VFX19_09885 [Dehalococcoidia bacterium]|nr:hypothetical protein [Dehalococcoidia bacterium]